MVNNDLITQIRMAIEVDLKASIKPFQDHLASPIEDMIAHHMGWQFTGADGKRVRPTLTLLCCGAVGGQWQNALPAATAIEWIHNFSLIHDDIQDQSVTRRGRDTIWTRDGVAQAINTGDAVFALARLTTQRLIDQGISPAVTLRMHGMLDQACLDLTVGQHLDIDYEQRMSVHVGEYMDMIAHKTGALLTAACAIGALLGGAEESQLCLYAEFGLNLGLAFQMYDDHLGIWGESGSTGKPIGDDIRSRKKTLPILYGIEASKQIRALWERSPASDELVNTLIQQLEAEGAKAHVLDQADRFTQIALSALKQSGPQSPYTEQLEKIALMLLQREH